MQNPFALGPRVGLDPQRHNFVLGILKFALPPTPTPNASRWNIGGVGSPTRGAGVGHVDFLFFVSISFALGTQRKPVFFSGIWALNYVIQYCILHTYQSPQKGPYLLSLSHPHSENHL